MDYHVDSIAGSDDSPGTFESPWRTLEPVNAQVFVPGDAMLLKRGSFWSDCLRVARSGVEGNPIAFGAYGNGMPPVIENPGDWDVGRYNCCVTVRAMWIRLGGFLLRNTHEAGVNVRSGGRNIFHGLEVTGAGKGIGLAGEGHNLITGCHFHDLHTIYDGLDTGWGAVGVGISGGTDNEICYNRMIDCLAPSLAYGVDGGAIELYGNVSGTKIHHNWAEGCDGFLEVGSGSGQSVLDTDVYYNVSVDNRRFFWLHLSGIFGADIRGLRVENNTVVELAEIDRSPVVFGFRAEPGPDTAILRNNIVVTRRPATNYDGFTHDHNLYHLIGGAGLGLTLGDGERVADPRFAEAYRLRMNSPARGAGVWIGHELDFNGNTVIDPPDLGVFQYQEDTGMSAVENLRIEAVSLREAADRLDAIAGVLVATDLAAQAAVVEAQEALAAAQVVEEAL